MKKKITVDLDVLRNLVSSTAPFAQLTGHGLPVFEAIELRGCGQYLVATASDRYVIAMKRAEVAGVDGFYALVPTSELKHLLATFKTTRQHGPASVTLTVADEQLRVSRSDGIFAGCFDLTVTYRVLDSKFPDLFALLEKWEPGTESATAYNAGLLAKFQAAVERYTPVHMMPGKKGSPTLVMAGDLFGAVMPFRARDTDPEVPDPAAWLAAVRPVKAVTK